MLLLSLAMTHANGDGGRRASPSKPALLHFHRVGRLDVAHARRIGGRLRSGMMLIGTEDDRLPLSRPRALEVGNCVLCARGCRRRAKERQRKDEISHRFLTCRWPSKASSEIA